MVIAPFLHMLSRPLLPALIALVLAVSAAAEVQTLTDKQGRSITVDVISVEGANARIKREDGRVFELPLSSLAEADEKKLRDWAAKEADKPIPADAIEVLASRTKFDSSKTESAETYLVNYTNGSSRQMIRTLVTTNEQWGYSITLTNRTSRPIDKLRADCIIFTGSGQSLTKGAVSILPVNVLKSRDRIVLNTGTVMLTKTHYKGETSPKPAGSQLYGIWVRIYRGDELIREYATPEGIPAKQSWSTELPREARYPGGSPMR